MMVFARYLMVVATAFLGLISDGPLRADDPAAEEGDLPQTGPTYQLQPGDSEATPLVPIRGRTEADEKAIESLSHFMLGELHLNRGENEKGIKELEKSLELNPRVAVVYRLLVPAQMRLGQDEQARKYALQAAEYAPQGIQLLRAYIAILLQQNDVNEAIEVLKAGLELKSQPAGSFGNLALLRTLGHCQMRVSEKTEAAAAYRSLFEALQAGAPGLSADELQQLTVDSGELYDEMGTAFLTADLPELALAAFNEAAKHRETKSAVHGFHLAQVLLKTGKPEAALQSLEDYMEAQHQEKGRAPYELLSQILEKLGKTDELLPRLEKLVEADKKNVPLGLYLADMYVDRDRFDDAARVVESTGDATGNPWIMVSQTRILWRQGKYDAWLNMAGQAFGGLQPRNIYYQRGLSEELQQLAARFSEDMELISKNGAAVDGILALANAARQGDEPKLKFEQAWLVAQIAVDAKRTDDVVGLYRYAIGMQNIPPFQLFQELGGHLIDAKRFVDAEAVFQEAADHPSLEPARSMFLSFVAIASEMDGRLDDAVKTIEECRKLSPDEPQFALQHARIYYRSKQWEKAVALFEEIINNNPKQAELIRDCRFSLSAIHVQLGQFEKGEAILLKILEVEPDQTQANNDLGYLWADRNVNLDKAV